MTVVVVCCYQLLLSFEGRLCSMGCLVLLPVNSGLYLSEIAFVFYSAL